MEYGREREPRMARLGERETEYNTIQYNTIQ